MNKPYTLTMTPAELEAILESRLASSRHRSPKGKTGARSGRRLRLLMAGFATAFLAGAAVLSSHAPLPVEAAKSTNATFVDYAQCANGTTGSDTDCSQGWINGILNANNSKYREDQVTPQRAEVLVPSGGPAIGRTLTFRYQARKGSASAHAYDSLATWNYTQTTADRNEGLNVADQVGGGATTLPIPADPQVLAPFSPAGTGATSLHQLSGQVFTMYGGTITGVSIPVHDCVATSKCNDPTVDDYASVTITYSVPDTSVDRKVQLLFGGHLAASFGPRGWGAGLGSASVSGGPYHIKWDAADGASVGNRDNQIMGSSILVSPTISTTPNPSSGVVGVVLNDSATLTGAIPTATGTITFSLYAPTDATCSAAAIFTNAVSVSGPGTYNTSAGYTTAATGTYHWTANYSGDANDSPASSLCADEAVIVGKASPTISTTPDPSSGTVGVTLNDSATLAGGFSPTGSITFKLFGPDNATCDPSGSAPLFTQSKTVSGNGTYSTTGGFATLVAGTYHWTASYGGDGNNNGVASLCADEAVVITGGQHGLTPGFWQSRNGHGIINDTGLLPVTLGVATRMVTITTIAQSDLVLLNSGCEVFDCSGGFSDSLHQNTFEKLASQTLALYYNDAYLGSSFSNQFVVALGCAIPTSLQSSTVFDGLALSSNPKIIDVFNLAQWMIGHSVSGPHITQTEASDMISLLDCIDSL